MTAHSPTERYPFFLTWQAQKSGKAIPLAGGQGVYFDTADGKRWLDMASFAYQVNVGHGERRIVEAIKAQADQLCVTMPNADFPAKHELARRLLALAPPGFDRVFFTLGGAEAVENAIKLARLVTGRHKLISRYRSYHGASMGALTLSGDWRRPMLEPGLVGVIHAMDCYCDRCPFGHTLSTCHRECARQIADLLELEGPKSVAAVVLEPAAGANGVLVPPSDYWPKVREACTKHGTLLIADEVLTGFGRTGKCFAVEHFGVVPDMITIAKGLTGGYATLGAVLVHERVSAYFDEHILLAGLTNYAHPLGCAAALAALDVYRDDDLFGNAARLGPVLLEQLRRLPDVEFVRGVGMLAAVEVELSPTQWSRLFEGLSSRAVYVHADARRKTIIVSPPLCINQAQIEDGVARIDAALRYAREVA